MAVLLKSIVHTHADAKAVFKDPTGEPGARGRREAVTQAGRTARTAQDQSSATDGTCPSGLSPGPLTSPLHLLRRLVLPLSVSSAKLVAMAPESSHMRCSDYQNSGVDAVLSTRLKCLLVIQLW